MMNGNVWTQDELNYIKRFYSVKSNREIADILNRSKKAVELKAIRLGLKKPEKRHYDNTIFEKIDNEYKAYWLGFIAADGTINFDEVSRNYELSLELKSIDDNHIKKFVGFLKTDADVQYRKRYSKSIDCTTNTAFVRIYSKKIIEDLIDKNIKPKKTFSIEYPKIEDTLFIWFLRGFFDGDGSIYWNKQRKCYAGNITCSNKDFLEKIRINLFNNYSINSYISKYINKNKTSMYQLHIKGKQNAINFFKLLYENSNIHLDRKYKLYLDCLNK